MATTNFTPGTVIESSWLNEVDEKIYQGTIAAGSTTRRTLEARAADVVNVKDFGAVGDGVADDTAAIQAAINAALTSRGRVFVPAGTYKVTSTLNCTSGGAAVLVVGESRQSTRFSPALSGTTPLFSFIGVSNVFNGAGVRECSVIAPNPGPAGNRNSGVAFYAQGAIGVNFDAYVKDMTYALHLHNKETGDFTEQVKFNIWSEYCQIALHMEVTSGDTSFHGCGGRLFIDIWDEQIGISVGGGVYWYNFDLTVDAIGHSVSPVLVNVNGTVAKCTSRFFVEEQSTNPLAFQTTASGIWQGETYISVQGGSGALGGNRVKYPGFTFEDEGDGNLLSMVRSKRAFNLGVGATATFSKASGGMFLIRDSSGGQTGLVIVDQAGSNVAIISDTAGKLSTTDGGPGSDKFVILWDSGAITVTNRFGVGKTVDVMFFLVA
jgi:hypothetical protein